LSTQSSRTPYSGIVTFLTDFGAEDGYAGVMKGVVLAHAPGARLVDITHQLPRFNLCAAALILENSFPSFPKGTIHVMVVDPGVGSSRRHLYVEAAGHFFIGPDNGVLGRIAELNRGGVFEIDPALLGVTKASSTFHGRDIYALAAAKLLAGLDRSAFSAPITDPEVLEIPEPRRLKQGLQAEVIYIDHFGNLMTNLRTQHLGGGSCVRLGKDRVAIVSSYSELEEGKPGLILNSWGYYEIAFREGSAAQLLGIKAGKKVSVKP
jgi:S-adenosylmethionine hydrolase